MNEKRLMGEIEKLCKDGHTDALLYLCRNYGDAAIEGYRRGYRKSILDRIGRFQSDHYRLHRSNLGHHETVRQEELIQGGSG